jgi:hydroxymethylpyrimidine/phosphomethylpyrimidine kinase
MGQNNRPVQMKERSCPVALSIAGSDNSAGAGIQADLKTFTAYGVYGLTAVTCVVAEIPGEVSEVQTMPVELVREQIRLCLKAFPVGAVKTGMLFSRNIILAVADLLESMSPRPMLVVDPVMVASSGDPLLQDDAIEAYRKRLFPMATLITPNLDEARVISGLDIGDLHALERAGRMLCEEYGAAFLMKGGHFKSEVAVDLLIKPDGSVSRHEAAHVVGIETHGSGCTYSSAITAGLAMGKELSVAVLEAKEFITQAIVRHHRWENGSRKTDALNHFARVTRY